ncbi:lytic transglycosylase domain-containing protein [Achromobacter aloeverae]
MGLRFRISGALVTTLFTCLTMGQAAAADCIAAAAAYHGINVQLLQAVVMQESDGNPAAINCSNDNKTCDYGLTQTNSSNLPTLARYGIERRHLFNGCISAYVAAWFLANNFARMGVTWDAVGAYNAVSQDKRRKYAAEIAEKVQQIRRGELQPVSIPLPANLRQVEESATQQIAQKRQSIGTR